MFRFLRDNPNFLKMPSVQGLAEGSVGLRNEISARRQPSRIFTPAVYT